MTVHFEIAAPGSEEQIDKYWEDQWLIGVLHEELAEAGIGYKSG